MAEYVVLVDENDKELGTMEKMEAHEKAVRHRAISDLVFNDTGKLMLQQRAFSKYHCGGMWSNTCCTHPRKGESNEAAAHRRLQEEMGFDCPLTEIFSFNYEVALDHGLTEKEHDHVFVGKFDGVPKLNPDEAADFKWISLEDLESELKTNPDKYTYWFRVIMGEYFKRRI